MNELQEAITFDRYLTWLAQNMANTLNYGANPQRQFEKVSETLNNLVIPLEKWQELDVATAKRLGFQPWDDVTGIYLIPAYLYRLIPAGLELYSLGNILEVYNTYKDLDNDARFGALAYGLKFKEAEDV